VRVVELSAADTHDLRRRVLRVGTVTTSVDFDGDDGAVHLGVMVDRDVVAVSSWFDRRHPDRPALAGVQLRGMAVEPSLAGTGLGSLLLAAGVERMRSDGAGLVWARARDTALSFYTSRDFEVFGEGYVDLSTGLPHHDVIRLL
jgi:GNAT superfamily N-acetyltransferase